MDVAHILAALLALSFVLAGPASAAGSAPPALAERTDAASTDATTTDATTTGTDAASTDATTTDATDTAASDAIERTMTFHLTPGTPGEVEVVVGFSIPSRVRSLETSVPAEATVVGTSGFTRESATRYAWNGGTVTPSIRLAVPTNETTADGRADGGKLSFADPGPWALVRAPSLSTSWRFVGDRVTLSRSVAIAGEGTTGGEIVFLGPHEVYERTAAGQRFRLVVPAAVDTEPPHEEVLDSLADASASFDVGDRDAEVFVVAAPEAVEWGSAGLQYGPNDAWVRADAPLDTADNAWLHEYVHTRQNFTTTEETRWLVEATAEYYAALLALGQGRIGFDEFRDHLARGTRRPYADAVLARPGTWAAETDYLKGALVAGTIDAEIRLAADRRSTLAAVLGRLNGRGEPITHAAFLDAVAAAGGAGSRGTADRFAATSEVPEPWNATVHDEAFDGPTPVFVYAVEPVEGASYRVTGPYRNRSATGPVVVGETVHLAVAVENAGDAPGDYEAFLTVDGVPTESRTGELAPGERAVVEFSRAFESPGERRLVVGEAAVVVDVREPATPVVAAVNVSADRVRPGEPITVTATVRNEAPVPGETTLPVSVDGRFTGRRTVRLDANASTSISVTVSFDAPGEHVVGIGEREVTVRVEPTPTPTPTTPAGGTSPGTGTPPAGTPTGVPGFGPAAAVVALLALLGLRRGR